MDAETRRQQAELYDAQAANGTLTGVPLKILQSLKEAGKQTKNELQARIKEPKNKMHMLSLKLAGLVDRDGKRGNSYVYSLCDKGEKAVVRCQERQRRPGRSDSKRRKGPPERERGVQRLPDHEAAGNGYVPKDGDWRRFVERQVCQRRGQQRFRDALRMRYGERCLVTGCKVVAVLEAAHIRPYRGDNDDNEENGLLLCADIHTLFDLDLIGIEPDDLTVELHPQIAVAYGKFVGKSLLCEPDIRPSVEPLRLRYEQFRRRLQGSN